MLHIAVCADEASVQAYLDKNGSKYVPGKVRRLEIGEEPEKREQDIDILLMENEDEKEEMTAWVRRGLLDAINKNGQEPLLIRVNGSHYRIERDKILYAESVGRKVVLHMETGEIAYYAKMKEVQEALGGSFFRCHRGYLVNFKAVKSYEAGSILLKNGETILMAKQKYNAFAAAYDQYLHTDLI